jgi:hypothetical protein
MKMIRAFLHMAAWLAAISTLGAAIYTLFETLVWQRFWPSEDAATSSSPWRTAVIYLSGISDYTGVSLMPTQADLVRRAALSCHADRTTTLPFPYSTTTAARFMPLDLWRRVGYASPPIWLFSLRNFWQAALCTWFPHWVGRAVAHCITRQLSAPGPHACLYILGNSAGAALAASAAPHLQACWPRARIVLIMCGGVFASTPGLDAVAAFHQISGAHDFWGWLPIAVLPGRRFPTGPYKRALESGRYHEYHLPAVTHFGPRGYLDDLHYPAVADLVLSILATEVGRHDSP